MKILYLAHYRDGNSGPTGWAQAAIDYISALNTTELDISCKPIVLNTYNNNIPDHIKQLENKPINCADVVIQHLLPHHMEYHAGIKNIGLFVTETSHFKYTNWPSKLNLMDELWVPNQEMVEVCKNSGVTTNIKVVPHTTNCEKFTQQYPETELPFSNDTFIFYTIGEYVRRKNLPGLIQAFHAEFDRNENVELVIKTGKPGVGAQPLKEELKHTSNQIKQYLRLYENPSDYHKELFITDRLTESSLLSLHKKCDCYVMPSYGESWEQSCFTAMGFGNIIVSNHVGGPADYLKRDNGSSIGIFVDGSYEPCLGAEPQFPNYQTGREQWRKPSIASLGKKMRQAFEMNKEERSLRSEQLRRKALEYDYAKIGKLMETLLCV